MFPKNADTAGSGGVRVSSSARGLASGGANPLSQGNLKVRRTAGRPTNIATGGGRNLTVNPNLPKIK